MKYGRLSIKYSSLLLTVALCAWGISGMTAHSQDPDPNPLKSFADQLSTSFRHAVEQVRPAVVSISAEGKRQARTQVQTPEGMEDLPEMFKRLLPPEFFDNQGEGEGNGGGGRMFPSMPRVWQGSGTIISEDGEILTNNHVVAEAEELEVTLDDGRLMDAEVVATDPQTDIALIKLKGEGPFPYAKLGDSEAMKVGDWVLAIGNPFGLSQSVSEGIVSAIGRTSEDVPIGADERFTIKNYIQTTAAINPGNSGGPLINLNGEIVGINNAIQTAGIAANIGIGFAIPSNLANGVVKSLKEFGKVRRGYIGVMLRSLTPSQVDYYRQEYGVTHGALVQQVMEGTPGAKAGLQVGDLITEYNGTRVSGSGQLVNMVTSTPVGQEVKMKVLRNGETVNLTMTLAERPDDLGQTAKPEVSEEQTATEEILGLKVQEMTKGQAVQEGFDEDLQGVYVADVDAGSEAAEEGIQQGDVISEINNKPVRSVKDFENTLTQIREEMKNKGQKSRSVLLTVHRAKMENNPFFVAPKITLDESESDNKSR